MKIKTYWPACIRELARNEGWDGEAAVLKKDNRGQLYFAHTYGGWYSNSLGLYNTIAEAEKALVVWVNE